MVIFPNWFVLQRLSQRLCEETNEGQRKKYIYIFGALRGVGTYDFWT